MSDLVRAPSRPHAQLPSLPSQSCSCNWVTRDRCLTREARHSQNLCYATCCRYWWLRTQTKPITLYNFSSIPDAERAAPLSDVSEALAKLQKRARVRVTDADDEARCQPAAMLQYIHSVQQPMNATGCHRAVRHTLGGHGITLDAMQLILALHYALLQGRPLVWSSEWIWTLGSKLDAFDIFPALGPCREHATQEMLGGVSFCFGYGTCEWASRLPAPFRGCSVMRWFSSLAMAVLRLSRAALETVWPGVRWPSKYAEPLNALVRQHVHPELPRDDLVGMHFRFGDACLRGPQAYRPACMNDTHIVQRLKHLNGRPAVVITDSEHARSLAARKCRQCVVSNTNLEHYTPATKVDGSHQSKASKHRIREGSNTIEYSSEVNRTQVLLDTLRDLLLLSMATEVHGSFYSNVPRLAYLLQDPLTQGPYTTFDGLFCPFSMCRVGYSDDPRACGNRYRALERGVCTAACGSLPNATEVPLDRVHPARRAWIRAVRLNLTECQAEIHEAARQSPKVY